MVEAGEIVLELTPAPDPVDVFRRLCWLPHCLFLDSALRSAHLGRWSFVAADPFDFLAIGSDEPDGWSWLRTQLASFSTATIPELPPFQGGIAGLFGYDLNRTLEKVPSPRYDEFRVPALAVGLYDTVVAFDHVADRAWIISTGFPERETPRRRRRAQMRLEQFRSWLQTENNACAAPMSATEHRIDSTDLAPSFPVPDVGGVTSNFSAAGYRETVQRAIDYIYAGDVFQVNIAQRLLHPQIEEPIQTYLRLRQCNPAPFAAYFDTGTYRILSASPERFLAVRGGHVETRPIKGTSPRCGIPEADLLVGQSLQASEKDRAENIMIVDLLRNDLSRVCRPESVDATQLCGLEQYPFVQHLVSVVEGELAASYDALDLIRAAFPGGSITGAPKVRAMELIAELEPTARGAYCGSLGYIGFDGALDLSILIRTITAGAGWLQMSVGGGIVAQSVPEREYEETWHKAHGLLRAVLS